MRHLFVCFSIHSYKDLMLELSCRTEPELFWELLHAVLELLLVCSCKCLFSLFRSASPSLPLLPPSPSSTQSAPGSRGGAKYLGFLPADHPDSAERPGRLQEGRREGVGGREHQSPSRMTNSLSARCMSWATKAS